MLRYNFMSRLAARVSQARPLEDWQYVASIQKHLKEGEVAAAMRSLINSNLDGKVLDLHTFRNMHQRMVQLNTEIEYHELAYKLYRDHFRPNHLMSNWMEYLVKTEDARTLDLLKQDYQALGLEFPVIAPVEKEVKEEEKKQKDGKAESPHVKININNNEDYGRGYRQGSDNVNTLVAEQIRKVLMEVLLENYSKVVVHDVEVTFNPDYGMEEEEYNDMYNEHEEHDDEHDEHDEQEEEDDDEEPKHEGGYLEGSASISSIKIGRIELYNKNSPNPDTPSNVLTPKD